MIPDALRPFLAALLTLPLRSLAGWLTARGIEVTGTQVSGAVEATLVWGLPLVSTLGVIGRRVLDKWFNPGNAASSHVAAVEKGLAEDLKAGGVPGRLVSLPPNVVAGGASPLPPIDEPMREPRHFRPPSDRD